MEDNLYGHIMFYTYLMDLITTSGKKIFEFAGEMKIEKVMSESQNRDRLLKILEYTQNKIENFLNTKTDTSTECKDILKIWSEEVYVWYQNTTTQDSKTAAILESKKNSLTQEIANVFKNKELHRGYANNSVKK